MTSSIPPGWYDDPAQSGMERWWDGAQWTDSARPPSHPGYPPTPSAPRAGNRNRTIILSVVALLLVGGLVAGLGLALGGGDDKKGGQADDMATTSAPPVPTGQATATKAPPGPPTNGTVEDPTTGVTIPKMKGWQANDPDSPAMQQKDEIACDVGPTADPDDGDCYLGEIDVAYVEGSSLSRAVAEVNGDINTNSDYRVVKTVKDEATKADGVDAHLLTVDIEENQKDAAGKGRTATMQLVFVDAPFQHKGTTAYPVVFVALYTDPKGPPAAVMDTVRDGIKVGTPQPTST